MPRAAANRPAADTPPVAIETLNDWAIHLGQNLPNHSMSLKGRGKFVRQGISEAPTFRTRQEAYRYAAWLVSVAEMLPDEDGCEGHDFDAILTAVRNT